MCVCVCDFDWKNKVRCKLNFIFVSQFVYLVSVCVYVCVCVSVLQRCAFVLHVYILACKCGKGGWQTFWSEGQKMGPGLWVAWLRHDGNAPLSLAYCCFYRGGRCRHPDQWEWPGWVSPQIHTNTLCGKPWEGYHCSGPHWQVQPVWWRYSEYLSSFFNYINTWGRRIRKGGILDSLESYLGQTTVGTIAVLPSQSCEVCAVCWINLLLCHWDYFLIHVEYFLPRQPTKLPLGLLWIATAVGTLLLYMVSEVHGSNKL